MRTFIQTGEDGIIEIGKANAGTVIQIGNKRHEFLNIREQVKAELNEDGLLSIV